MANQESAPNMKMWDKVIAWYASKAYAVNMIYSLGASVVIIGALFKILHWPGASYVLMVGMFTEAFLFMLGIFEKPHASYHWENVFPQLVGDETKELLGGGGVAGKEQVGMGVSALPETELKALKEGISKLSETALQLNSLGNVAEAGVALKEKMTAAGTAVQQFAGMQDGLARAAQGLGERYQSVTAEMDVVAKETKNYSKAVADVNTHLSSLNAVYELQLKTVEAQSAAFKAQTEKMNGMGQSVDRLAHEVQQMQEAATAALQAGKQYEAAQKQLAQQVADLNKVYGNMLNALA